MNSLIKNLNNKKSKTFIFYVLYIIIISTLLFIGLSGNIHADTANTQQKSNQQYKQQNRPSLVKKVRRANHHFLNNQNNNNWFRDGLNNANFKARSWVSWHESRNHWRILSYGHRCIGYFQLDPRYLGYVHGHVNLNHKHQVKVADHYARIRYGNWIHAKRFWQIHHWY